MIGRYVSQGYENPSFGFAISLPDTYTLENRNNVALNDADIVESSNSEGTYDYLKIFNFDGKCGSFFRRRMGIHILKRTFKMQRF